MQEQKNGFDKGTGNICFKTNKENRCPKKNVYESAPESETQKT